MSLNRFIALCGVLLLGISAGSAFASLVPAPTGTVEVPTMGASANFNYTTMSTVTSNPDGTSLHFMGNDTSAIWDYTWVMDADADPFVDAMLTFQNLTGITQTFNVAITLPVSPAFSPGYKSGSVGFNFSDSNNSGAASVTNISWDGRIDGSPAMQLLAGDLSCGGAGCGLTFSPVSDGPLLHPAGVSSSIGILLGFDLSGGDTVTFDTRFEVTPVPVPAAVWLFGSGLLGLVGMARRKKTIQ